MDQSFLERWRGKREDIYTLVKLVMCACGVYPLDPEEATYVRDGKPLCHEETCARVAHNRRQTIDLRRAPFFDCHPDETLD